MPRGSRKYCALFILIFTVLGAGMAGCAGLPRDWSAALRTQAPPTTAVSIEATFNVDGTPTGTEALLTQSITLTQSIPPVTPTLQPNRTRTPASARPTSPTAATATVTRRPTLTPTITPTPQLPLANIEILKPGPASKVVSPINLNAYVKPGARGNVQIELLGEDGRLLVRKILSFDAVSRVNVITDLEFEISAVAEAGRIVISVTDQNDRITSLASVDLILMSMGEDDINPSGPETERIVIRQPQPKALIQGGTLQVSGLVFPMGTQPLLVEILNASGNPIGPSRLVNPDELVEEHYFSFATDIPYSLAKGEWVLVVISERDSRIPGIISLTSVEVFASP